MIGVETPERRVKRLASLKAYRERTKKERSAYDKRYHAAHYVPVPKPTLEELAARKNKRREWGRNYKAMKLLGETPEQREARLVKARVRGLRWYHRNHAHARSYYAKNQAKILAREKARAAAKPPEVKRAYLKQWYAKNRDTQRTKNLEYQRNNRAGANRRSKAFALRHPERVQANGMKRRARMMGAQVGDMKAIADWMKAMRALPSFICYFCEQKTSRTELHFDHVIALARGGKNSLENMAASCSACNFSKNAKLPSEWNKLPQKFLNL